jgi:FAD:protein FMN transferase
MSSERMNDPAAGGLPDRRAFLTLGVGAFVAATLPWAAPLQELVRRTIPVMGTFAEVAVVHRDARHAQGAIDAAFAELRRVESSMSRFRDDSDIGRANLEAAGGPVAITPATAAVIAAGLRWAAVTDGRFDPALARAVALWDVTGRRERPAAGDVRRFAGLQLFREVELDRHAGQEVVRFHAPEVALDLGGIAKGHAVDRAVEALREWGIAHALVNAGGDLYALGHAPDGEPWRIGIRSPRDPARLAGSLLLEDRAVATSGDYEHFFEQGGVRYHHLLDPATAEPRRSDVHSVTVAAATCLEADAGATAVFGCTPGEAARLLGAAAPGSEPVHIG